MLKIRLEEVSVVGDSQTYIPQHNIFLFCLSWDTQSVKDPYIHHGIVAHPICFPSCQCEPLLAVAMMKNRQL